MIVLYPSPTVEEIVEAACSVAGWTIEELREPTQDHERAEARRLVAASMVELHRPPLGLRGVAEFFARHSRSTAHNWLLGFRRLDASDRIDLISRVAAEIIRARTAKGWRGRCVHCCQPATNRKASA